MQTLLSKYHNRENGFTLIELLIVVLIIGILAAIAIPIYLGLQNQAKNNSTKQDVNSTVHTIQVALTEGQTLSAALNANSDSGNRTDGTNVTASPALDGSKNYTVVGTQKDTQFTYTYDSATGKFTEGSAAINLGGGAPSSPPAPTSVGTYTYNFEDGTTQNWAPTNGTQLTVGTGGSHPKALYASGYLTNGNGNYLNDTVSPLGTGVNITPGHTYKVTYSYYMLDNYAAGSGTYITQLNMSMGQGSQNLFNGSLVKGTWTTQSFTWNQTNANQPFTLIWNTSGYNGGTVGLYLDDVTIQALN